MYTATTILSMHPANRCQGPCGPKASLNTLTYLLSPTFDGNWSNIDLFGCRSSGKCEQSFVWREGEPCDWIDHVVEAHQLHKLECTALEEVDTASLSTNDEVVERSIEARELNRPFDGVQGLRNINRPQSALRRIQRARHGVPDVLLDEMERIGSGCVVHGRRVGTGEALERWRPWNKWEIWFKLEQKFKPNK